MPIRTTELPETILGRQQWLAGTDGNVVAVIQHWAGTTSYQVSKEQTYVAPVLHSATSLDCAVEWIAENLC